MTLLMQNMLKSNLNRYNLFRKHPKFSGAFCCKVMMYVKQKSVNVDTYSHSEPLRISFKPQSHCEPRSVMAILNTQKTVIQSLQAKNLMQTQTVIQRTKSEESHAREKARPVRDISLTLNMTEIRSARLGGESLTPHKKPSFRGLSPKNLMQDLLCSR